MEYLIFTIVVVGGLIWLTGRSKTSSSPTRKQHESDDDDGIRIEVTVRGSEAPSRSLSNDGDRFWIPQGRSLTVQGYRIDGGMLYSGKGLAAVSSYMVEPALIDPRRPVNSKRPAHGGEGMDYWPSYEEISPGCRAAYLDWLAGGRHDPNAYIGYVFLYFYGLERRILHDHVEGTPDNEERVAIFNEVKRLLKLYGNNSSFARYAEGFLFAIYLARRDIDLTDKSPVTSRWRNDIAAPLKVGLGQLAKAGKPIPADWALAWVQQDPDIRLRTPARRCEDEFAALFKRLYHQQHGDGLIVKPNKTPLSVTYHPASAGLRRPIEIYQGPPLPDVTILKRPRTVLTNLADQASDKLDAYSRFIGKDGTARHSLYALALLPTELSDQTQHAGLDALREAIESHLNGHNAALLPMSTVLEHFPVQKPDRIAKREAVLLAQLLEKMGLGMEPDVRFSEIKPKPGDQLVVFRQTDDAPSAPSQTYDAATLVMRLAAMVSAADGEVSPDEERHLQQYIETTLSLEPGERRRLHAHMQWLLQHDRGMAGLKPKLEDLSQPQRETIGQYLATLAQADGRIDPGEVKTLQKLYGRLGLDPDRVVSDLHGASSEPVTVKPASPGRGYAIPEPPDETTGAESRSSRAALDPAALQRKLEDTAHVSGLLYSIFGDQDPEEPKADSQTYSPDSESVTGLDAEHSAFLLAVGTNETWDRSSLEQLASQYGLLLDGALETINEVAFDRCDAPCLEEEEDDSYVLDRKIYEVMTS